MVNVKDVQLGTTTRKIISKINELMKIPNLNEVHNRSKSAEEFLPLVS